MADFDGEMRLVLPGLTPERYRSVIELLDQGLTADVIGERTMVSTATVKKIRALHPEIERKRRDAMLDNLEEFAAKGAERLSREIDQMDLSRLPLGLGIVIDKIQLLKGQATQRVEHSKGISQEDLIARLQNIKKANAKVIDAESVKELPNE